MTENAAPPVADAATSRSEGHPPPLGQHGPWPPPPPARLLRTRSDRKIAGVAGGLGRYTGIDPLIFRIVLVVLAIFGGSGILLYGLGWLFVPEEGEPESEVHRLLRGRGTLRVLAAGALAMIGVVIFGQTFVSGPGSGVGNVVALAVIGIAAYFLLRSGDGAEPQQRPGVAGGVSANPSEAPPAASGTYGQTPGVAYAGPQSPPPSDASAYAAGTTAPLPPHYPPPPSGWVGVEPPVPPPPKPRREPSMLGRLTFSAALLVVGILLAFRAADSDPGDFTIVPAAALTTVGLGLLVGAFYGRSRWLILLGVVLALLTAATAASESTRSHGVGRPTWAPTALADVQPVYRLGVGNATLDLSAVSVPAGERLVVQAAVDLGELTVHLPEEAAIDIDMETESGGIVVANGATEHIDLGDDHYSRPGKSTAGTIELDLRVGLGSLTVIDHIQELQLDSEVPHVTP